METFVSESDVAEEVKAVPVACRRNLPLGTSLEESISVELGIRTLKFCEGDQSTSTLFGLPAVY